MKRTEAGNIRGAVQLLQGLPPVHPCTETVDAVRQLFHTTPLAPADSVEFSLALAKAKQKLGVVITDDAARRRLYGLSSGAEPGPSGCRNTHLKALLKARDGIEAFRIFSSLWTSPRICKAISRLWLNLRIAPLRKPNGGIRPIGLCECLLKASIGLCTHSNREELQTIFSPQQVSVFTAAGAEEIVIGNRALAVLDPHLAQTKLDMRNAFGRASKAA